MYKKKLGSKILTNTDLVVMEVMMDGSGLINNRLVTSPATVKSKSKSTILKSKSTLSEQVQIDLFIKQIYLQPVRHTHLIFQ